MVVIEALNPTRADHGATEVVVVHQQSFEMETIPQCIIRTGFKLSSKFYYRNSKTGDVMIESLPTIGDEDGLLSLNDAIQNREELLSYFDAVEQAADLYSNEFLFRHFALDFSIYDAEGERKLLDFPFHRSFSKIYGMLRYWMNEASNGAYHFQYDNKILDVLRHREYMCFSEFQIVAPLVNNVNVEQKEEYKEKKLIIPQDIKLSKGYKAIPTNKFRTLARPFLNTFWHELFLTENFCRQVSKEYGLYENIWMYRRLVPQDIDLLILSQNNRPLFVEVQDVLELSTGAEDCIFSDPEVMIIGVLKKGLLRIGDKVAVLNSCYDELVRYTVDSIEHASAGDIEKASPEIASKYGDNRFVIGFKGKRKQDFDGAVYLSK